MGYQIIGNFSEITIVLAEKVEIFDMVYRNNPGLIIHIEIVSADSLRNVKNFTL